MISLLHRADTISGDDCADRMVLKSRSPDIRQRRCDGLRSVGDCECKIWMNSYRARGLRAVLRMDEICNQISGGLSSSGYFSSTCRRLLRVGIVLLVQYSSIRLCPRSAVWLLYCFLDSIALDVRCIISMLKSIEVKI
jgi:hypothetical protein